MKSLLSLIFLIFWSVITYAHPLHLSLCNIEIEKDSMHIALKIFEDDFAAALENRGAQDLLFDPLSQETRKDINTYLNEYFVVELNGNKIPITMLKTEQKDLAVWIHFNVPLNAPIDKLVVSNQVMLHWFNDQKNLLIVNYQGREQGFQFDNSHLKLEIPIKK